MLQLLNNVSTIYCKLDVHFYLLLYAGIVPRTCEELFIQIDAKKKTQPDINYEVSDVLPVHLLEIRIHELSWILLPITAFLCKIQIWRANK